MSVYQLVAKRLAALRHGYNGGRGISQRSLARELGLTPNVVSRWESLTYKPTLEDISRLAEFFSVGIEYFLTGSPEKEDDHISKLMEVAKHMKTNDLEELIRYAEFRLAESRRGDLPKRTK